MYIRKRYRASARILKVRREAEWHTLLIDYDEPTTHETRELPKHAFGARVRS